MRDQGSHKLSCAPSCYTAARAHPQPRPSRTPQPHGLAGFLQGLLPLFAGLKRNPCWVERFNVQFLGSVEVPYHQGNGILCAAMQKVGLGPQVPRTGPLCCQGLAAVP